MSTERIKVPIHPIDVIKEWRKGCSCTIEQHPSQCEECTENAMKAIEGYFALMTSNAAPQVSILMGNFDREGSEILGVYADSLVANKKMKSLEEEHKIIV